MPATDVDTVLVAIRMASYGTTMEISTTCPHCKNEADYGIDLRNMLENMRAPDYSKPVTEGDLEIYFKPMSYQNLNENNQRQFEEQKILQVLPGIDETYRNHCECIGTKHCRSENSGCIGKRT
jgi:hypothetical protein